MKKNFTLILIVMTILSGYSQFSKIHYIPPITGSNYGSSVTIDVKQYIYISTPSVTPVTVKITLLGVSGAGGTIINTITNANPWVYTVTVPVAATDGSDSQLFVPFTSLGKILNNRGYLIEANDLVYANLRVQSRVSGTSPSSSQAGSLVAKGTNALGKEFRIGGMENRGVMGSGIGKSLMNFTSFMASENDTHVTITLSNPATIGTTMVNGIPYTGPISVTLNKNESYVMAIQNTSDTTFESNNMLGGLIVSDKNIVVNCGSIAGNSQIKDEAIPGDLTPYNNAGKDFGFDQIIPFEKTGKEYIFVGGAGIALKAYALERAIIIASVDGTQVFKDGTTLVKTLNAGEYYVFNGSQYTNGNLYVRTSENVFAYQCIGGAGASGKADSANQNMFFVPPISCTTPSIVNNIPLIEQVGTVNYPNTIVNIVTEGAGDVTVNGVTLTPATNVSRTTVLGMPNFVRYSYPVTGGNVSVVSAKQVYVSYYGSNDNATYGSYYSGFDTAPEITLKTPIEDAVPCISSLVQLSVASVIPTDSFVWQYNGVDIPGESANTYTPKPVTAGGKGPGYYNVVKISACTNMTSVPIAISECPADADNDGINDNVDGDLDNDGITNSKESYGDKNIDASVTSGTLTLGDYSNSYTSTTIGSGFTGNADGSFITNLTANNTNKIVNSGKNESRLAVGNTSEITYKLDFAKPISLGLKYNPLAGDSPASLSNAQFTLKSDLNKTITVLNPSNQIYIDTNYDGIYESGVTEFTSFDIRFVLNYTVLLPVSGTPPAVDFTFQTNQTNTISFTHKNISASQSNKASFSFYAVSVPKDSNGDGIPDQLDKNSLGVNDFDAQSKFILYPNPTTGVLNVESNIADDFTVVNQLGQVVKTVKVNVGTNKVNLENLVDGIYFLKNKSGENQVVKKIIKN